MHQFLLINHCYAPWIESSPLSWSGSFHWIPDKGDPHTRAPPLPSGEVFVLWSSSFLPKVTKTNVTPFRQWQIMLAGVGHVRLGNQAYMCQGCSFLHQIQIENSAEYCLPCRYHMQWSQLVVTWLFKSLTTVTRNYHATYIHCKLQQQITVVSKYSASGIV